MAFTDLLSEQERKRQEQMMQAQMLKGMGQPTSPNVMMQDVPVMMQDVPNMGQVQQQALTGAQQTQLDDIGKAPIRGMKEIMSADTPTLGTALAKTLAAGVSGHYGRKEQAKEKKTLEKALRKDATAEAKLLKRATDIQDAAENRKFTAEERAVVEEARKVELHEERGVQNEEHLFRATAPDLKPGTAEYGKQFAKFLEDQDTRYGGGGGRASAGIQKFREWQRLHPDATQKEQQDEYEKILSSFRTTEVADVDFFTGTGDQVLGGEDNDKLTPEAIRETVVQQEGAIKGEEESAKLSAQSYAAAEEKLGMMDMQIAELQDLIEHEDFDGSVGLLDQMTGWMSEDLPYFGDEGKHGKIMQMAASNMVLKQADFLKGNLNTQELNLLLNSVPDRSTDEDTWKTWFRRYKAMHRRAQQKAREKQTRGVDPFEGIGGEEEEVIYLD